MEEVPFDVVNRCLVQSGSWLDADGSDERSSRALEVALRGNHRDFVALMATSKTVYRTLHKDKGWLRIAGFQLVESPPDLSCYRLLCAIMNERKATGGDTWAVKLLSGRVDEAAGSRRRQLRPLLVHKSAVDAKTWWTSDLAAALTLPTIPTLPQCDKMAAAVARIEELSCGDPAWVPQLLEHLAAAVAAAPKGKANKTVPAFLLHEILKGQQAAIARAAAAAAVPATATLPPPPPPPLPLPKAAMATLLAAGGVETIRCFVLFSGGVPISSPIFKKGPSSGKPPKMRTSYPSAVRRGVVAALDKLSWLALTAVRRNPGLFKVLFKSIHIGELASSGTTKSPKVFLLQALLRGSEYPKDAASFAAHGGGGGGGGGWAALIAAPLRAVCADPLFEAPADPGWLSEEFQPHLAERKLPWPEQFAPVAVLCKYGNGRAAWEALFRRGQLTVPQVFFQLRGLALLAFPPQIVESYIEQAATGANVSVTDVLKLHALLSGGFSAEKIAAIVAKARAAEVAQEAEAAAQAAAAALQEEQNQAGGAVENGQPGLQPPARRRRRHPLPPGADVAEEELAAAAYRDEVKVVMQGMLVKDKKGMPRTINVEKKVSTRFGSAVMASYLAMLERLMGSRMDEVAAKVAASALPPPMAVISYTEELACNAVRTGLPPAVPSWAKVSMWRGEVVSLQQLGAASGAELLAGIHWCQAPQGGRVDLDLSVLLLDSNFGALAHCDYTRLKVRGGGAVHSGDFVDAPYPAGARETVLLKLPLLRTAYPRARYVALVVFSFSGIKLADLHDASVFVADAAAAGGGSGPGGAAVLGAARLTGEGTASLAAYIDLGDSGQAALEGNGRDHVAFDAMSEGSDESDEAEAAAALADVAAMEEEEVAAAAAIAAAAANGDVPPPPVPAAAAVAADAGAAVQPPPPAAAVQPPAAASIQPAEAAAAALPPPCPSFVFMDHSLKGNDRSISGCSGLVGTVMRDAIDARDNPATLKLSTAAAMAAATLCVRVVVAGAGAPVVLTRADAENRAAFFKRIVAVMAAATPAMPTAADATAPAEGLLGGGGISGAGVGSDVVFFGGSLDPWLAVARQHKLVGGKRLFLANVHADAPGVKRRPLNGQQEVVVVDGWDVAAVLAGLL